MEKHLKIGKERSTQDFEAYLKSIDNSVSKDLNSVSETDHSENKDVVNDEFLAGRIDLFGSNKKPNDD